MSRCRVCDGRRYVRLALSPYPSPIYAPDEPIELPTTVSFKDYPCPECSQKLDDTKVMLVGARVTGRKEYLDQPRFKDHLAERIANMLGHQLLESRLIAFREPKQIMGSGYGFEDDIEINGTIGVVTTATIATMEQRIAERQLQVADRVAEAASVVIVSTAAHDGWIRASEANEAINKALKAVKKEMS